MHSPKPGFEPFIDTTNIQSATDLHTPILMSPPDTKTPSTITGKRTISAVATGSGRQSRSGSEPANPTDLSEALQQYQEAGQRRERTPMGTPSRKRQRVFGDRFIPNRTGQDLSAGYALLHEDGSPATPRSAKGTTEIHFQKREANRIYSALLRSEMFGGEVPQTVPQYLEGPSPTSRSASASGAFMAGPGLTPSTPHKNLFNYSSSALLTQSLTPRSISRSERGPNINPRSELYSLSPIKRSSQNMLLSPRKSPRAVSKVPYKVLDAPDLADDFYLNLVDWGSSGVLAVGLGECVYLWNKETGTVNSLCKFDGDNVTSVAWIQRGSHLAIGTSKGLLYIYDTENARRVRTMTGHTARISSLTWNSHILSTGSRDRTILHRDVRNSAQSVAKLTGHKQEVCGLKWNSETEQLASGGNDNKIFIWDRMGDRWLHRWGENEGGHKAAVKAIAWSPHKRGLLASGGGTADRCIKFWNTVSTSQNTSTLSTGAANFEPSLLAPSTSPTSEPPTSPQFPSNPHLLRSHDTGSQVCNLLFSTLTSELVSTHGYSQHAINIWKYPSMDPVVSLTGHTFRVLYLSMSPDGKVIVTGAGDETLRFWDVFGTKKSDKSSGRGGIVGEWGVIR